MKRVLDERSRPSLRSVLGDLLARAGRADIALSNVRLAMLDLTRSELGTVRRCRILLGRLDARAFGGAAPRGGGADADRHALLHFLSSGRVEVRSAGLATWAPDFSLFRELDGRSDARVCLIGAHYFHDPVASTGPSFTVCVEDDAALDLVCSRFEELWANGYDVREAVTSAVQTIASAAQPADSSPGPVHG